MGEWSHTGYAQRIVFGAGSVERLGELLEAIGARRALLVTTPGRLASADGARVVAALGPVLASTFAEAAPHVPAPLAQRAVGQARRDAVDSVVSYGGGSCADLGKAVCYFVECDAGPPGASWADRPALGHVSVPTTYSGAELTPFFGMTDPTTGRKSGVRGPTIAPLAAVYDPELTVSTPPRVSAETGMNALAHCVEIVYSPKRTPESEALGLAGAARIVRALPLVIEHPGDVAVRASMLEGAVLGGRCLQNGTMGVHHGLAQLLGGRTGMAHGLANAVLLSHAVRFNAGAVPAEIARLGKAIGAPDDPAKAIDALVVGLGLPTRLGDCGVTAEDIEIVAQLSQSNANVAANPRPVSEEDARAILAAAY